MDKGIRIGIEKGVQWYSTIIFNADYKIKL